MTLLRDKIYVAFDTETTGLSARQGKVVEIAGVRFTGTGTEIARFSTLANPGSPIGAEVTRIHGIDDTMVAHAPSSADACEQFAHWLCPQDVLLAHNAAFDVAFITSELIRSDLSCPKNAVVDTLRCARQMDIRVKNHKLGTLVEYFGFPATGYHRAMADSLYVMQLFLEFINESPSMRIEELQIRAGVDDHHASVSNHMDLQPRFQNLAETIAAGEVLTMRYDGSSSAGPKRVMPLTLCSVAGVRYLVAQCMADGSVRQFELDRIISLEAPRPRGSRI